MGDMVRELWHLAARVTRLRKHEWMREVGARTRESRTVRESFLGKSKLLSPTLRLGYQCFGLLRWLDLREFFLDNRPGLACLETVGGCQFTSVAQRRCRAIL
jgi:hypothetical protein